jgi:chitin synthase
MHCVKGAVARTDVPTTLVDLIKQRRRWLNGSLFALLYALIHFDRFYTEAGHHRMRKAWITVQLVYMWTTVLVSFVGPALFYMVIYYVLIVKLDLEAAILVPTDWTLVRFYLPQVTGAIDYVFISLGLVQVIMGLSNKPSDVAVVYQVSAVIYAAIMALATLVILAGIGGHLFRTKVTASSNGSITAL